MKNWIPLFICSFVIFTACKNATKEYLAAENGLDAGREFITSCNEGNFNKAAFYMVTDNANSALLANTEKKYRENDKEGRQLLRQASINIQSVIEPTDTTVQMTYGISGDTTTLHLWMIKRNGIWLVDYKKTFK